MPAVSVRFNPRARAGARQLCMALLSLRVLVSINATTRAGLTNFLKYKFREDVLSRYCLRPVAGLEPPPGGKAALRDARDLTPLVHFLAI